MSKSTMREYVSLRAVRLAGLTGHVVHMQAKIPQGIPPSLEAAAIEKGCVPADGALPGEKPTEKQVVILSDEAKHSALAQACHEVLAEDNTNLFTADGLPRIGSVKSRLDPEFEFDRDQLELAWLDVKTTSETEQV